MRVWLWLRRYWAAALFAVLALAVLVLTLGRLDLRDRVAHKVWEEAEKYHEELRAVELEHQETLEALDEKQRKKADALREDPRALSRYLVRVGRKGR